jgi:organic hydroperoxide reductase OsmC/OhrA
MTTMTVQLRSIPGTQATVGWAEGHNRCRSSGRAGGMGLGFNGGQLLGLAIGGCFCNDLQYVAHDMGIILASIEVNVTVTLEGNPLLATQAKMRVDVTAVDKTTDTGGIIRRAQEISAVSNSLKRGVPVQIGADTH